MPIFLIIKSNDKTIKKPTTVMSRSLNEDKLNQIKIHLTKENWNVLNNMELNRGICIYFFVMVSVHT